MANRVMTWIEADNQGTKLQWTDLSGTTGPWVPSFGTVPVGTTATPLVSTTGGSVAGSTAQPATASETYVWSSSGQNWDPMFEASPSNNPIARITAFLPHVLQGANSFQPIQAPLDQSNPVQSLPAVVQIMSVGGVVDRMRAGSTTGANLAQGVGAVQLHQWTAAGNLTPVWSPTSDAIPAESAVTAGQMGFNAGTSRWDRLRTPTTFVTATFSSSGSQILWTPAAAKRWRIMGIQVMGAGIVNTAGGNMEVTFNDGTSAGAPAIGLGFSIPMSSTLAGITGQLLNTGLVSLGNGIVSSSSGRTLAIVPSTSGTTGELRVNVFGVEE